MVKQSFVWTFILVGSVAAELAAAPAPKAPKANPLAKINLPALRLAVADLAESFPKRYPRGAEYIKRIDAYAKALPALRRAVAAGDAPARATVDEILAFQREALLANPLLAPDEIPGLLLISREPVGGARRPKGTGYGLGQYLGLPRQSSWQHDRIPNKDKWENEINLLAPVRPEGKLTTVYRPKNTELVCDIELHYDAKKLLFSMPVGGRKWQVFELALHSAGPKSPRQVTPTQEGEVHNYDAVYLPNDRIAFISTAPLQGVPCNATVNVGMLYVVDGDGGSIRQLCFDQDHNYSPTLTNDGRILYLRWEYTDLPHVWGRYLFTMNPDGTSQREYYGSGEYWPNGMFYARAIPGHATQVVTIVTGHHVGRVGELVIFDPALGRKGVSGVVQRIPQRGKKVEPLIQDRLTQNSWPKFLHPYPLGGKASVGKYFLVSAKPRANALWGIYLADVFDNMTLVRELEGRALLEPIPLRPRSRPPMIADRVDLTRKDALMKIDDVYVGPGLKGVPRGSVKKLRLFTYHFAYQRMAGINQNVGVDGPWEPKRIIGEVPVEDDGSAFFRVPANTPIAMHPLDAEGKALQLMRSWTTAMPGELVSCIGCHEGQNDAAPNVPKAAFKRPASQITPWHGPVRGFSFVREVQGVLDKYCVACHDGKKTDRPDLRRDQGALVCFKNSNPAPKVVRNTPASELVKKYAGVYPPSFIALRTHVRVGGFESDIRLLDPGEFHADTSPLVQMLVKGHHGVKLPPEAWGRLVTWIDLNAPCHGNWTDAGGIDKIRGFHANRRRLANLYASIDEDPEAYPDMPTAPVKAVRPKQVKRPKVETPTCKGWPFDAAEARRRQAAAGKRTRRTLDLGAGVTLGLVLIPAGRFVMGSAKGHPDEGPPAVVTIDKPFWMGAAEITNEQYQRFDATHDSRFEHKGSWIFSERHLGWRVNGPKQPVVRVSWEEARAFCAWLKKQTGGAAVDLPTEAQWEYACRAGADTPLSYGDVNTDFSKLANLADVTIRNLAYDTDGRYTADLVPRDKRFNDKALVTANVGSYAPNAWSLHDMHGNVAEWTRSSYLPYPYDADDTRRNDVATVIRRVVRGGSWRDLPKRSTSTFRLSYPLWQRVYNVGFRVVIPASVEKSK